MWRISLVIAALLLASSSAFAQSRTFIAGGTWEYYGTPNPIGSSFFPPYNINFPSCFKIVAISNPPWDPNGAGGTDHYLEATGACNGSNPGPGVYFRENIPHRAHDIVMWFRLKSGTVSSGNLFITRMNDSTSATNTGIFDGAVDYSTMSITSTNLLESSETSGTFALDNNWHQVEQCWIAGVNGSGTIPTASKLWVDQTLIGSGTPGTVSASPGGGDTITFDDEPILGSNNAIIDFGPFEDYDVGTSCPAAARATIYDLAVAPSSNSSPLQFTPTANANWQNAAANPAGNLSFNFDATAGQQDYYSLSLPIFTNVTAVQIRMSVQKDAGGTRVALPLYDNSGTPTTCAISNGITLGGGSNISVANTTPTSLVNGTYQALTCSLGAASSKIGIQVTN